ncbi:hypothetical protein Rhopal_000830-T1 [Rhodotorula paludigena]|uniref:Maltose permease n=1 Tax=Rhodotorula paludigena TaxID=86838 RepID=A0AAV5G647_9BASI|nr:hypothetical protein Rhopal_000830-T1 [Rhodotorula paludigena]
MALSKEPAAVQAHDAVAADVKNQVEDYEAVVSDARAATHAEHTLTLREGLKRYPAAIGWSMLLSTAIIMTGFDIVLLGSFYGLPQFNQKFGVQLLNGSYTVTAAWQAGLSNGAKCGEIIGLAINGWAMERFGCRKTMITALSWTVAMIFLPVFAQNVETILAGQILMGYLTAYVNMCWVLGQLVASGALRGVLGLQSEWAFRIPFALQWMWPVPIIIGCCFAPESPWWLVRKGRYELAKKTVRRLVVKPTDDEVDSRVAMMIHTNALEKAVAAGTSYWDCFKGIDLRRTEIAVGVWSVQNLCGAAFMGYSTFFLQQAGLPTESSFDLSIGQYGLGLAGTICSWFLMTWIGRRKLYFWGLVVLTILLIVIGGMGFISRDNTDSQWAVGAMLLIYTAAYDATVGPVCYTLVSEVSSTRLRGKTVVIARVVYNVFGIVNGVIMPYMLNTEKLDWGAKTGLFWGGMCFLCATWTYFRVPEPRGRTYGELDILFQNKVSARKFAKTSVDQFAHAEGGELAPAATNKSLEKGQEQMIEDAEKHSV